MQYRRLTPRTSLERPRTNVRVHAGCPFLAGSRNGFLAFRGEDEWHGTDGLTQGLRSMPPTGPPPIHELPPGNLGQPLIGETLEFMRDRKGFLERRRKQHGPIWKTSLLGRNTIYVSDVQAARQILAAEHKLVGNSPPETFRRLLGPSYQGVFVVWKRLWYGRDSGMEGIVVWYLRSSPLLRLRPFANSNICNH